MVLQAGQRTSLSALSKLGRIKLNLAWFLSFLLGNVRLFSKIARSPVCLRCNLNSQVLKINNDKRRMQAREAIVWRGDLEDDCTAEWAGLMLRAEWMDEDYWWWAVYDMQQNEITIDSSNEYHTRFIGGEAARAKAESVAKAYLGFTNTDRQT